MKAPAMVAYQSRQDQLLSLDWLSFVLLAEVIPQVLGAASPSNPLKINLHRQSST